MSIMPVIMHMTDMINIPIIKSSLVAIALFPSFYPLYHPILMNSGPI